MRNVFKTGAHDFFVKCYRRAYISLAKHHLPLLKPPQTPPYVQLELTNDCNMACPHCARQRYHDRRPIGYIDLGLFKAMVDEMSGYSWCFLRIAGLGEPALHPNLADMLDYLQQRSIRTELVTNGTLLMKFTPQQIMDWGIEKLGISIDGHDSASYSRHQPGGGNYDILRSKVVDLFSARKAAHKRFPEIEVRNIIFPETSSDDIRIYQQNWLPFSDNVSFTPLRSGEDSKVEAFAGCWEPDFAINVRWDGRVPLCGQQLWYAETEWLGNVEESNLKTFWKSQRLQNLRTAHHNLDLCDFEFCKRCLDTQDPRPIVANAIKWNKHRNPVLGAWRYSLKWLASRI